MNPSEIWRFVKSHTLQFEKEIFDKALKTVKNPSKTFTKTAAINIQDCPGFNQDKVIQQQAVNLGNYIIQVTIM